MTDKKQNLVTVISGIVARIEADERFRYKPANVYINAPLALIQVDMTAEHSQAKLLLPLAINQQAIIDDLVAALTNAVRCGERDGMPGNPGSPPAWVSKARTALAKAKVKP
mgnify:CR=1 FL=1